MHVYKCSHEQELVDNSQDVFAVGFFQGDGDTGRPTDT